MKLSVKRLNGSNFLIEMNLSDTVADVKKKIETVCGSDVYPATQQMLIHQGKILNDDSTTLKDNQFAENNFVVVMSTKNKHAPPPVAVATQPATAPPQATPVTANAVASSTPVPQRVVLSVGPNTTPLNLFPADTHGAVNANSMDIFPQGFPGVIPNASADGYLNFLPNSQLLQSLQANPELLQSMSRDRGSNPQILQSVLQGLRNNPGLMHNLLESLHSGQTYPMDEPFEGEHGILGQQADAMPQVAMTVTPEEQEAIERLEDLGFNPAVVLEVFFAFDKNEELAANYLLDHMDEFDQ